LKAGSRKVLEIQGLRAFAASLVLVFHAKFVPGGFIGVDIFYVISGFLITGLLLNELNAEGRISLKDFYLRRSKRLLPASFLVLFITALFAWIVLPPISRGSIGRDLIAATLYISNYLFAWWQNDYQNLNATPSPFIHFWSLAVEEQFYLFWPIFIILISKFCNRRKLFIGFASITVASFLLGVWVTAVAPIWAFYSLPTRAWELGIGALIALLPVLRRKSGALALLGALGLIASTIRFNDHTSFPGANALLPVLGTAALLSSIGAWPQPLKWLATNRVSTWLGKISYPLYLWHWPVLVLPISLFARDLSALERIVALIVTVALAALTNRLIEEPLRLRKFTYWKVLVGTASAMFFLGLIGLGIGQSATSSILVTGKQVTLTSVQSRPEIYDDGCHLNFQETLPRKCEFGKIDSKQTVVLYGDSHAAQWFPALKKLASDKGFRLISITKSSCPSIAIQRQNIGAFKMASCAAWRKNAIKRITIEKPDLIVLSSFEHYVATGNTQIVARSWQVGSLLTYKSLQKLAPRIVYLVDTPLPIRNIPDCLTVTSAEKCFANAKTGLPQVAKFDLIDPTKWLCQETCPAIVRGNVAYRDASHISVATSLELSDRLWQALLVKGISL